MSWIPDIYGVVSMSGIQDIIWHGRCYFCFMSKLVKPKFDFVEKVIQKGIESIEDKIPEWEVNRQEKIKKANQEVAKKFAEQFGIQSIPNIEDPIRNMLNDHIIYEVKRKRLTHATLANIALTSRSRITAILNRNIQEVSIDSLLKILGCLGVSVKITLD